MTRSAGVLRDAASLADAADAVATATTAAVGDSLAAHEIRNLAVVGRTMVAAATAREESRGAHARADFPETDPAYALRFVVA